MTNKLKSIHVVKHFLTTTTPQEKLIMTQTILIGENKINPKIEPYKMAPVALAVVSPRPDHSLVDH